MAYIIIDNPQGCWKNGGEKPENCRECYYSQVRNGVWCGSQKCWNADCLKYGGEKA